MTTYQEYQSKIAELSRLAEQARKNELQEAKAKIHAIMDEFGVTLADLGPLKAKKEKTPVAIKYRNDGTGETWTGRGRVPRWLDGKDKNDYLVKN